MFRDYYQDGFNDGYGRDYYNPDNDQPESACDQYSYRRGHEDGKRRREIANELDREYFGDTD